MKAVRVAQFGEPDVLQLADVPVPQAGPGQVLVRIHAAGVNPVEMYIRSGTYAVKPELPYTPGGDGAGVVEAVGSGVATVKQGDRVYTSGTITGSYAEYALCSESQVHPLPARVSFTQGAAVGIPYATAYRALMQRAAAHSSETVLVHGASGGVGIAAVQLADSNGMRVFGTAGTEEGRRLVKEQGADEVFDHTAGDYLAKVMEATGGRGVDVILEMQANRNLGTDLSLLAPRGRIVVIGSRGRIEIDPRDAMKREADIRGMVLFNTPPAELAQIHLSLIAALENETIRPVIGREFPLAQAREAHIAVMQAGARGKIVLVPGRD